MKVFRWLVALLVGAAAVPVLAARIEVHPGESIQAAVDAAQPGDRIIVFPGTYMEPGTPCPSNPLDTCAVAISKADIKLIARSRSTQPVIIENPGGQTTGIEVSPPAPTPATCLDDAGQRLQGSLVKGFTVNNFDEYGIFLLCVEKWRLDRNSANGNLEYGLFPSHTVDGRMRQNTATGANDTGIYIGQSRNARVSRNAASDNVSGFEIENSTDVRLDRNLAEGNTAGILSFLLPNLDQDVNTDNIIRRNEARDNNRPNTCLDPDDIVCLVPPGTGILVIGADSNRIDENKVTGNGTFGIAMVDYCVALALVGESCPGVLDIDPTPEDNTVARNTVTGNGLAPDPLIGFLGLNADLFWDGSGSGNCWKANTFDTEVSLGPPLPTCP